MEHMFITLRRVFPDVCVFVAVADADTRILHVSLLKRNRKGHYANGCTNASTYWWSLMAQQNRKPRLAAEHHSQQQQQQQRLPGDQPPMKYYWSSYEAEDLLV